MTRKPRRTNKNSMSSQMIMSQNKNISKRFLNKTNTCWNFFNAKLTDSQNNKL